MILHVSSDFFQPVKSKPGPLPQQWSMSHPPSLPWRRAVRHRLIVWRYFSRSRPLASDRQNKGMTPSNTNRTDNNKNRQSWACDNFQCCDTRQRINATMYKGFGDTHKNKFFFSLLSHNGILTQYLPVMWHPTIFFLLDALSGCRNRCRLCPQHW